MGISSLTLFKHALGRRRILIHTHPPVESACLLAQLAAVISSGEEGTAGVHAQRINVLGVVGLTDLDRMEIDSNRGNGWIACEYILQ
jgi:predicted pyridoxine 5'-phosphate oxidase superfamily flavin-nucleotide-binding protein